MPLTGLTYAQYYKLPNVLIAFEKLRPLVQAELAAENLNLAPTSHELATFVGSLLQFQLDHLGPTAVAASRTHGIVRLPGRLFKETQVVTPEAKHKSKRPEKVRPRKVPSPSLVCILATSWKFRQEKSWSAWDFSETNQQNIFDLVRRITDQVCRKGFFVLPNVAIHPSVQPAALRHEIETGVHKLQGVIVPYGASEATHVILPSDGQDYGDQEFYRTLEKTDSLVCLHYWYRPDSADVWLINTAESQFLDPEPPPEHDGPWMVYIKWITDSLVWNEFMNEEDYEAEDSEPPPVVVTMPVKEPKKLEKVEVEFLESEKTTIAGHVEKPSVIPKIKIKVPVKPAQSNRVAEPVKPTVSVKLPETTTESVKLPETKTVSVKLPETKTALDKHAQDSKVAFASKRQMNSESNSNQRAPLSTPNKIPKDSFDKTQKKVSKEVTVPETPRKVVDVVTVKANPSPAPEKIPSTPVPKTQMNSLNMISTSAFSTPIAKPPLSFTDHMFPPNPLSNSSGMPFPSPIPAFSPFYPPGLSKGPSNIHSPAFNPMVRPPFVPPTPQYSFSPKPTVPAPPEPPRLPWWREHPFPLFKIIDLDARQAQRIKKIEFEPITESQGGILLSIGRYSAPSLKLNSIGSVETKSKKNLNDIWLTRRQDSTKEEPWFGVGIGFVVGGLSDFQPKKSKTTTNHQESLIQAADIVPESTGENRMMGFVSEDSVMDDLFSQSKQNCVDEDDEDEMDAKQVEYFISKLIRNGGISIEIPPDASSSSDQKPAETIFKFTFPDWFNPALISNEERKAFPEFLLSDYFNQDAPMFSSGFSSNSLDRSVIDSRYRRLRNAGIFFHVASQLTSYIISNDLPASAMPSEILNIYQNVTMVSSFSGERCWNGFLWERDPLYLKKIDFPEDFSSIKPRRSFNLHTNSSVDVKAQAEAELEDEIETAEIALSSLWPDNSFFWLSRIVSFWESSGILGMTNVQDERPVLIKSTHAALLKEQKQYKWEFEVNRNKPGLKDEKFKPPDIDDVKSESSEILEKSELNRTSHKNTEPHDEEVKSCFVCGIDCSIVSMASARTPTFRLCCDCFSDGKIPCDMPASEFFKMEHITISDSKLVEAKIGPEMVFSSTTMEPDDDPWTMNEIMRLIEGVEKYCTTLKQGEVSRNSKTVDGVPKYIREWEKVALYVGDRTKEQCLLFFSSLDLENLEEFLKSNQVPEKPKPEISAPLVDEEEEEILRALEENQQISVASSAVSSPKVRRRSTRISAAASSSMRDYSEWDEDEIRTPDELPTASESTGLSLLNTAVPNKDIRPIAQTQLKVNGKSEIPSSPTLVNLPTGDIPMRVLSPNNILSQTPLVDVGNPLMWLLSIIQSATNPGIAASSAKRAIEEWGIIEQERNERMLENHLEALRVSGLLRNGLPMKKRKSDKEADFKAKKMRLDDGLESETSTEDVSENEEEIIVDARGVLEMFREKGVELDSKTAIEATFGELPPHMGSKLDTLSMDDLVLKEDIFDRLTRAALDGAVEQARKLAEFEDVLAQEMTCELEDAQLKILEWKLESIE